jgi:predicted nuclease with RNAse H fold
MKNQFDWLGIDFGAKTAGTTVICEYKNSKFSFYSSEKGKDADAFVLHFISQQAKNKLIFIDAPLSLPSRYTSNSNKNPNYFYRLCDIETKAMSPMFIGGLTARAIQLKDQLQHQQIVSYECYPGMLAKKWSLDVYGYKKDKSSIETCLTQAPSAFKPDLNQILNWHHFDAWLAWCIGYRHAQNEAVQYGHAEEGLILV